MSGEISKSVYRDLDLHVSIALRQWYEESKRGIILFSFSIESLLR